MRTRIAVALDDETSSGALVAVLRDAGYLVVEPEVADFVIIQIGGRSPGIRISGIPRGGNNDGGLSRFLPAPVTALTVLTSLLRLAPPRRAIGGQARHLRD